MFRHYLGTLIGLFILAVLATACGGTPPEGQQQQTEQEQPPVSGFPRTIVDHAGNQITIETQPERIAVGHFAEMEYFFALGVPPVASPLAEEILEEFTVTIGEAAAHAEVVDLGDVVSPDLERLLETQPDLIIGTIGTHDDVYDQLKAIADVVMFDNAGEWDERLRLYASLIGKEAEAEEYIASLSELMAEAKERLRPYGDETTALFRFSGSQKFGAMGTRSYAFYYDKEDGLGLTAPEHYPETWEVMDLEGLSRLDPDHLVIFEYTSVYEDRLKELEENPVWNALKAVKNDQIHFLDISAATNGPFAIPYAIERLVESYTR